MNHLVDSCLDCINDCDIKDLAFNWEDDEYVVKFKRDNCNYNFIFCRRLFGIFSYISLYEKELYLIKENRLSKSDFKRLKNIFNNRLEYLNNTKFNTIFKNFYRENKIDQIIK